MDSFGNYKLVCNGFCSLGDSTQHVAQQVGCPASGVVFASLDLTCLICNEWIGSFIIDDNGDNEHLILPKPNFNEWLEVNDAGCGTKTIRVPKAAAATVRAVIRDSGCGCQKITLTISCLHLPAFKKFLSQNLAELAVARDATLLLYLREFSRSVNNPARLEVLKAINPTKHTVVVNQLKLCHQYVKMIAARKIMTGKNGVQYSLQIVIRANQISNNEISGYEKSQTHRIYTVGVPDKPRSPSLREPSIQDYLFYRIDAPSVDSKRGVLGFFEGLLNE